MKDINRLKVVLVEQKETSKWLAGELDKDFCNHCKMVCKHLAARLKYADQSGSTSTGWHQRITQQNRKCVMKKDNSPYTAAFTGCSFMMYEMIRMLPLFLASNADELVKKEIEENQYMMVNSIASRKKYGSELKRSFTMQYPLHSGTTFCRGMNLLNAWACSMCY